MIAASRIEDFLENFKAEYLVLSGLGLKSLPDVFNNKLFISRLIHLLLSNNKLESFPNGICQLQYLKSLTLNRNGLTSLSNEICQLQRLEVLDLSDNKLQSLPNGISQLQHLKSLTLIKNCFASFPNEICQLLNLEFLTFSHNELQLLPEEIGRLRKLTFLGLSDNSALQGSLNILLSLPRHCKVNIQRTNFSEGALRDLKGAYNRQDYQGPEIFFPVTSPSEGALGDLKVAYNRQGYRVRGFKMKKGNHTCRRAREGLLSIYAPLRRGAIWRR